MTPSWRSWAPERYRSDGGRPRRPGRQGARRRATWAPEDRFNRLLRRYFIQKVGARRRTGRFRPSWSGRSTPAGRGSTGYRRWPAGILDGGGGWLPGENTAGWTVHTFDRVVLRVRRGGRVIAQGKATCIRRPGVVEVPRPCRRPGPRRRAHPVVADDWAGVVVRGEATVRLRGDAVATVHDRVRVVDAGPANTVRVVGPHAGVENRAATEATIISEHE